MSSIETNKEINSHDDEIDLQKLLNILWEKRLNIAIITSFFIIISVAYSLSLSNIYKSQALLSPATQSDSLSSKLAGFSSIVGIAGISLPTEAITPSTEGIQRIRSYSFFSNHFLPNIKLENLLAIEKWDRLNDVIYYNEKSFDFKTSKWVRKAKFPKTSIPSDQEAYKEYLRIVSVEEDKATKFINISVEHQSPQIAKLWLDIIIKSINESMRELDKKEATKSIEFLNVKSKQTNLNEIKLAIAHLLESQMQNLMLASASENYVFKILDEPIVPEEKSSPNRAILCILGAFFGIITAFIYILLSYFIKSKYPR